MRNSVSVLLATICLLAAGPQSAALAGQPLTVVELYTSQGCSSCPPADAVLNGLAERPELLALSFHVDYWNYLGWKDPFSSAAATERQRSYNKELGRQYVYTPQIVVDGAAETVGSREGAVESLIEYARTRSRVTPEIETIDRTMARIRLPGRKPGAAPASVWLVFFDKARTTEIERGENAGRTITYANVVRRFERIGTWHSKALELTVALDARGDGHDSCAVIVQTGQTGPVLGAARIPMPAGS